MTHTLRTPPTANRLKGGEWAAKKLAKPNTLAFEPTNAPRSRSKEKSELSPKIWRGHFAYLGSRQATYVRNVGCVTLGPPQYYPA